MDLQSFLPGQSPTARGWLDGGGLQDFRTGQGLTACWGGLQEFLAGQSSTSVGVRPQDFRAGQSSSSLRGAELHGHLEDLVPGQGSAARGGDVLQGFVPGQRVPQLFLEVFKAFSGDRVQQIVVELVLLHHAS